MARGLSATGLLVLMAFGLSTVAFVGPVVQQPGSQSLRASRARTANQEAIALSDDQEAASPWRLGGAALSMLAAIALALLPMEEAQAAKSGGRIGGSAPAARRAPPARPAAPRAATTTNNTTVINKTTVVASSPVVVAPAMGYGYGGGFGGGGMIMAPAPTLGDVVVGAVVGGAINNAMYGGGGMNRGPSNTDRMLDNQQRQDERQMDRQASEIDQLKTQISQLAAAKK